MEIILPKSMHDACKEDFSKITKPAYARVIMPLSAILEGDFFTDYIKKGNVLMLSEGVLSVDNVFSLREGILTMTLDKESYERAGLVGKPDGAKGSRGARARWVVEINLRLPSMLHGKKGFDRIVYAAKNVLNKPLTWLFCNVEGSGLFGSIVSFWVFANWLQHLCQIPWINTTRPDLIARQRSLTLRPSASQFFNLLPPLQTSAWTTSPSSPPIFMSGCL